MIRIGLYFYLKVAIKVCRFLKIQIFKHLVHIFSFNFIAFLKLFNIEALCLIMNKYLIKHQVKLEKKFNSIPSKYYFIYFFSRNSQLVI